MRKISLPGSARQRWKLPIDFIFARMGLNIVGVKIKAVDNFHAEVLYFALVLQISEKNLKFNSQF